MTVIFERRATSYEEMLQAARARLEGKNPKEIANKACVEFDGTSFSFHSFGQNVRVTYPDYEVIPHRSEWLTLVILHYLDLADGTPLTGQPITFAQQKDGLVRGSGFDRLVETKTARILGKLTEAELVRRCIALGGVIQKSNADLCAAFSFLPMYPLVLKMWFADEDFPASGRLLLDSSAEHYLTIEDAVTLGETFLQMLESM